MREKKCHICGIMDLVSRCVFCGKYVCEKHKNKEQGLHYGLCFTCFEKTEKGKDEKPKKIIYTDATCDGWQATKGSAEGSICLFVEEGDKQEVIFKEKVISHPKLKQFINRFELWAVEEALFMNPDVVYTDSQVARKWARDKKVQWISRNENKAGLVLESHRHLEKLEKFFAEKKEEQAEKIANWSNDLDAANIAELNQGLYEYKLIKIKQLKEEIKKGK